MIAERAINADKAVGCGPICRIELFGGVRVRVGDRVIERFRTRKAAALLGRLALYPDRAHPREELVDLLWSEMDPEHARNNLRQAVCTIRRVFSELAPHMPPVVLSDKLMIRLDSRLVSTDVVEFRTALSSSRSEDQLELLLKAATLYRGELLSGLYDDWILPERRRLESLFLEATRELTGLCVNSPYPAAGIPHALRATAMDPLCEELQVGVMRLYAAEGQPAAVSRQFEELSEALKTELGESPSEATRESFKSLLEASTRSSLTPVSTAYDLKNTTVAGDQGENISCLVLSGPGTSRPAGRGEARRNRLAISAAACAFLVVPLIPTFLRVQRLHADPSTGLSKVASPVIHAEDPELTEMRMLRSGRFNTGSEEDRIAARRRHAELCLGLAEKAWLCWYGHGEERWLNRFTEAHEELRSALKWLLENNPPKAVQLSGALARFWYVRGFSAEGYRWLRESLVRAPTVHTTARARALVGSAFLSPEEDADDEAQYKEAHVIFRECGDRWGEAHALRHLGYLACCRAQFGKSQEYYRQALDLFTKIHSDRGRAVTLLCISFATDREHGVSRAVSMQTARQSLDLFRKLDNPWGVSMALHSLGMQETDIPRSNELIQKAIATYPEANGLTGKELDERAIIATRRGDYKGARKYYVEVLRMAADQNNKNGIVYAMDRLLAVPTQNAASVAHLLGAALILENRFEVAKRPRHDRLERDLVSRLGRSRFESELHEGERMNFDVVVAEAASLK